MFAKISDLINSYRAKLAQQSNHPEEPYDTSTYRVFTTDFDEVIGPEQFPELSADEKLAFDVASRQFTHLFLAERIEIGAHAGRLVRDLRTMLSAPERASTVVSFLIGHSGSMRGLRMLSALLAVEVADDALENAGIASEVLGFTTAGWLGGKSRQAWIRAGRPPNPGRLCDLRHIVYSAARGRRQAGQSRSALKPGILFENIDGESLAWAASRLDPAKWQRRCICIISDGAPVDDSTLMANDDQTLLERHLIATEQRLAEEGLLVGTLGLGPKIWREPAVLERAHEPLAAGVGLIRLIRRLLLPDVDAAPGQAPSPEKIDAGRDPTIADSPESR